MSRSSATLESVGRAISALLLKQPFHAHVLMGMRRLVTEEVETAAVTVREGRVCLLVNPSFWLDRLSSDRHRQGVLQHEVLHVVLGHLIRHQAFGDKQRFNVAADLAVNCLIGMEELPAGALHVGIPGLLDELDQRDFQTVDWYYQRLLQPAASSALQSAAASVGAGSEAWGDADPRLAGSALADLVGRGVRALGSGGMARLPAMLRRLVAAANPAGEPPLDWRRVLRVFSGRSRRTRLATTLKRPSKRYGRVPGVRVRSRSHVAVAIDTSGSVDSAQLSRFMQEVDAIRRTGTTVTLIHADHAVRHVEEYRGGVPELQGGCGTDFDPAIEWVNGRRHLVDGLIYFTDAEGPRSVPCRCRLLWLVVGAQAADDDARPGCALPGERVVRMDPASG
jgi:predicted metal-dependent peptidase